MFDHTLIMIEKNERIREEHQTRLKAISEESVKLTADRQKQLEELKQEMKELQAFKIVYKQHSVNEIDAVQRQIQHSISMIKQSNMKHKHGYGSSYRSSKPKTIPGDPFYLKKCLIDSGLQKDKSRLAVNFKYHHSINHHSSLGMKGVSSEQDEINLREFGRHGAHNHHRSNALSSHTIAPAQCSSYYSLRQYYEKEKDKLLDYWSPTEKRKRAIQRIMADLGTPNYSAARHKVSQLSQLPHGTNKLTSSESKRKPTSHLDVLSRQKWRNLKLPHIDEINYPH